jgi:mRNA interferase MazF
VGVFTVGEIVLVPFPYADFSRFKKRPALVIGEAEFNNLILCQITSKADTSKYAISLHTADFSEGALAVNSYIRFDKLFTIEQSIIERTIGNLKMSKVLLVKTRIREIFS